MYAQAQPGTKGDRLKSVCVIIPAYNPGAYLREALASVVAQTYQDWECIVVDDGSDEDLSWVATFDDRVKLIRQPNRGVSAARNRGIAATDATWIAMLDADDAWHVDKLYLQLEALGENSVFAMCHSAAEKIVDGASAGALEWVKPLRSYDELVASSGVCTSSVLVSRVAVIAAGGFDETLRAAEDYALWLKVGRKHPDIAYLDTPLVRYRVHESNASLRCELMARSVDYVLACESVWIQAQGREDLKRVAVQSRKAARLGWGSTSYNQSRKAVQARQLLVAARHLYTAMRLAPGYTVRNVMHWAKLSIQRSLGVYG